MSSLPSRPVSATPALVALVFFSLVSLGTVACGGDGAPSDTNEPPAAADGGEAQDGGAESDGGSATSADGGSLRADGGFPRADGGTPRADGGATRDGGTQCQPNCDGKSCGDNGCGGSCGTCGQNFACQQGLCRATCVPNCDGRSCGDDGCGGTCGTCASGQPCNASGQCTCPGVKRVFTTTARYSGNLASEAGVDGGLAGGDAICATEAAAANLTGTFKAWLSTATESAIDRIADVGPWVLAHSCTQVFANKASITVNGPAVSINRTAAGTMSPPVNIWTGSGANGRSGGFTCNNWKNGTFQYQGVVGVGSNYTFTGAWTQVATSPCDSRGLLICFEQ